MGEKQTGSYDVIIIGGGPAGMTAGLYTSRARLRTLLIENGLFGGQMTTTELIENYPGFPQGVSGEELSRLRGAGKAIRDGDDQRRSDRGQFR